jgi:hypothetical protein
MARPRKENQFQNSFAIYCRHRKEGKRIPTTEWVAQQNALRFTDLEGPNKAVTAAGMRKGRWLEQMADLYAQLDPMKDVPFELHRINEYDIQPDEIEDIAYIWTRVKELSVMAQGAYQRTAGIPDVIIPPPTVRMVEWWARVMRMCPSLRLKAGVERILATFPPEGAAYHHAKYWAVMDVYYVGGAYLARELQRDMLGKIVTFEDLDGCLAHAPWAMWDGEGEEGQDDPASYYLRAVKHHSVPMLKAFNPKDTPALIKLFEMKEWLPKAVTSEEGKEAVINSFLIASEAESWPVDLSLHITPETIAKVTENPKNLKKFSEGIVIENVSWQLPSQSQRIDLTDDALLELDAE